jgi:hypothetical protein
MHETLAARTRTDSRADIPKDGRGPGVYDKAYKGKIDSDGWPLAFEVYAPAVVAHYVAAPALGDGVDLYKGTTGLLSRPTGSTEAPTLMQPGDVRDLIREALSTLPEVPGAAPPYRDLALLMNNDSPATVARYLDLIANAVRVSLPRWRAPKSSTPRPAGRSRADRAKAQRAREHADEVASAREWLALALDDDEDPLLPGQHHDGPALHTMAVTAIEDLEGEPLDDEDPDGPLWRAPGPRTFYAVADHVLGARTRSSRARYYVIPEHPNRAPYEESPVQHIETIHAQADAYSRLADEAERATAAVSRYWVHVDNLTAQRDRVEGQHAQLAATGTDGVVHDLGAHRARRGAR